MAAGPRMELHKIKQLIDVLAASDLAEIELTEGDHRVRLVQRVRAGQTPAPFADPVDRSLPAGHGSSTASATDSVDESSPPTVGDEWLTAPLHGTLHLAPAPDAAPFVRPGDMVQPGQTLCMVEAMKMFHEVKAERRARIVVVVAENGHEVEAGAHLMQLTVTD